MLGTCQITYLAVCLKIMLDSYYIFFTSFAEYLRECTRSLLLHAFRLISHVALLHPFFILKQRFSLGRGTIIAVVIKLLSLILFKVLSMCLGYCIGHSCSTCSQLQKACLLSDKHVCSTRSWSEVSWQHRFKVGSERTQVEWLNLVKLFSWNADSNLISKAMEAMLGGFDTLLITEDGWFGMFWYYCYYYYYSSSSSSSRYPIHHNSRAWLKIQALLTMSDMLYPFFYLFWIAPFVWTGQIYMCSSVVFNDMLQ